jgi:glycosyltransferase involved in cell wall biosynthesis
MHFGPVGATSIDLCIRDFVKFSRYAASSTVIANWVADPFSDVRTALLPDKLKSSASRARKMAELARALKPSLIVVHQHLPTAVRLRRLVADCPVVLHVHNFQKAPGFWPRRLYKGLSYSRLDGIICVSEAVRERFTSDWRDLGVPAFTAHNGIDTADWHAEAADKEPVILFAGRLAPEKGVLEAATAVVDLLPEASGWSAEFILSEPGRHPAYAEAVKAALAKGGDRVHVRVDVRHDEVKAATRRAGIAMVPSVFEEPFGRTAIEAMASRCAVVYSARGGLPEVVADSGLALDEVSAPAIIAALRRLVADPVLRTRLGEEARRRAETLFDIRAAARHLDAVYDEILLRRRGGWEGQPRALARQGRS